MTLNGPSGLFLGLPPDLVRYVLIVLAIVQLIVIFLLALAVKKDADFLSDGVFLLPPRMWFVVVFMTGGYAGALAYWLIHYSTLRHRRDDRR